MNHKIENYSFGQVQVNGQLHTKDLIIHGDEVVANWRRKAGHSLVPEDIQPFLPEGTRTLIIGCGSPGMLVVPDETVEWCNRLGITLIAEPTKDACERYNALTARSEVVFGLHLTC